MEKIRKGSIVGRKSYGKDILFVVEKIVKNGAKKEIAILKGVTIRIEADAFLDDLELINQDEVENSLRSLDDKLENRIKRVHQRQLKQTRELLREQKNINRKWNNITFRWR